MAGTEGPWWGEWQRRETTTMDRPGADVQAPARKTYKFYLLSTQKEPLCRSFSTRASTQGSPGRGVSCGWVHTGMGTRTGKGSGGTHVLQELNSELTCKVSTCSAPVTDAGLPSGNLALIDDTLTPGSPKWHAC